MDKKYVRSSDRKFHIVYKTTCTVTGRFYIGLHSTDDLNDGYLGSGKRLIRSVSKHGKENHKRETLFSFNTRQEASDREKAILTEEFRTNPNCLNCGPGGLGATDRPATSEETRAKLSAASKNYVRTEEWYKKIVQTRKERGTNRHTEEDKKKISEAGMGRVFTEEHKQKISEGGKGQTRSEETCAKISNALKGKNKVKKPLSEAHKESIRQSRIGKKHSESAKANMRKPKDMSKNQRPCTVDGKKIYPSVGALVAELGTGKNGSRSPTFSYIFGEALML